MNIRGKRRSRDSRGGWLRAGTGGSARASRFAPWKNGLYAYALSMSAAAIVIRTLYSIVWPDG